MHPWIIEWERRERLFHRRFALENCSPSPSSFLPPPSFGKLLITLLEVVGPTISVRRSPVLETIPSRGSLGGNKVGRGERIKEEKRNGRKGERHEGGRVDRYSTGDKGV